ncbi:MAG: hypothetical protein K0R71_811 [Bacillales bacterium]|jgi:radical SAM superfamily enzyme YgiQ (UPF0313 family)|nr:hypothetical protein [Bacillales bacterium]
MKIIGTTLNAKYIHTNLALRFLKSYAAPEFQVEIVEFTIKDPVLHVVTELAKCKPDIIGFSCYIWNIEETRKIATLLKKILPNTIIVLGGPEVTFNAAEHLKKIPAIDCIVIGEGEATFKELLYKIQAGSAWDDVYGLAWRKGNEFVINTPREKIDLQSLKSAYRFDEDLPNLSKRITYYETSRGCPFNCQFCLSSTEIGVRYFNREQAKADLKFLIENGAKTIKFMDRTFNISRSYAMDIFEFLIANHTPGMSIQFEITADIMRPEVIEYLNENAPAGLFRFEIGVQSTNDNTNALVNRKQNFDKLKRIVTLIKEGGKIDQHLDLIAGLPEEDYDSFRKTFNDVFELRPEELQLGFLKMLNGTGLTRDAEKYGYKAMDEPPYEMVSNDVLPFEDVIHIKQVEDVLEKYWNDHRMDLSIEYLVRNVFETPFDFFQSFGTYWDERGWSRIGHQLEDLFRRLVEFMEATHPKKLPNLLNILKFDYLSRQTYKPRSAWWGHELSKEEKNTIYYTILENPQLVGEEYRALRLNEKDLFKHTLLERLSIDIDTYQVNYEIIQKEQNLLIYFDPETRNTRTFLFSL